MLLIYKPVDRVVIRAELLIELFGAEFLLPAVLEKANDGQHQKKDAEKI